MQANKTNTTIIGTFIFTLLLVGFINSYFSQDSIKKRLLNEVNAGLESIDGSLKQDISEKMRLDKCKKENSGTGILFDCNTLVNYVIEDIEIIEQPNGSGSGAVPPKGEIKVTYQDEKDKQIMDKICKIYILGNKSPLCNNYELYYKLKTISESKGVDFYLMLGISYSESHIFTNYAGNCRDSYNPAGIKWRKTSDNINIRDQTIPQKNGCRVYYFNGYEDAWNSFANSIYHGFIKKQCTTPECISKYWVRGDGKIIKRDWVNNVKKFYN